MSRDQSYPPSVPRRWWVAVIIPFLTLVAIQWTAAPRPEIGDPYHYLLHARALVSGDGYSNIGYIFTELNPWTGPRQQPPGLPMTLFPLLWVFGANLVLFSLPMIAAAVVFLIVAGRYFAMDDPRLGLGVTLLTGLVGTIIMFSTYALADLPFCALLWILLTLVDADAELTPRRLAAITVVGLAALSYRLSAAAIVPTMLVYAGLRLRDRGARLFIPPAVWSVFGLVSFAVFSLRPGWLSLRLLNPSYLIGRWTTSIQNLRISLAQALLEPFPFNVANDVYHLVAALVMLVGLGGWLLRNWNRFLVVFAVGYLILVFSLPIASDRYLWPLHPLIIFGVLNGVAMLARRLAPRVWRARASQVALASAVVLAVPTVLNRSFDGRATPLIQQPDVREVLDYVDALTDVSTPRMVFVKPRFLVWETGVRAMPVFDAPPDSVLAELDRKRITHVVTSDLGLAPRAERSIREAVAAAPDIFHPELTNDSFTVYRYRPGSAGPP